MVVTYTLKLKRESFSQVQFARLCGEEEAVDVRMVEMLMLKSSMISLTFVRSFFLVDWREE